MLLCQANAYAQSSPQPPCGNTPTAPFPELNAPASVQAWTKSDDWKPPPCTGWTVPGFATVVTTAARVSTIANAADLLRRIGAISKLTGIRYWSTTHKQWRTLIVDAHAVTDGPQGQRREDFQPDELKEGKAFNFEQLDNLTGKAIYRMRIIEASTNRIVFGIENVSPIREHFLTIFHPGEMQTMYFLDRESEGVWRFYSILRTGKNASRLAGNEASTINRAVALYRHFAGLPTDQEPPAAR